MKSKIIDNREKTTLELKDKIVVLTCESWDTDIDMDDMLKIDHHNIYAEIITVSVAINRVGNLLANMTELVAENKLDFDIFMAQKKEEVRKELSVPDDKGKIYKATIDEIDSIIIRKQEYKVKKQKSITLQKNWDIINSYYWAMQSKANKLEKLSEKLRPEEFEHEIVQEKINGVMIQKFNKAIK